MRFKTFVRCSASLGALVLSSSPAWAQAVNAEQPQTAQETPADSTDIAQEAEEGAIVVTGIRESLRSAQNIRRNSDQIVDAIIAEDIGKLPDIAVSDTAARIPGVQVIRQGGEASRVLIRGLPDFATTYNGREIFTAETRVVALQDFPSANIAALEVFKTTTANLVEAGLAGLVNVRSRRPFDFQEGQVAGTVWGLYTYQAGKLTPNANFLVTDRWETGAGDIGILLNASYTELEYLDSEPSNTDFLQTFRRDGNRLICCGPPADARFPDIQRLFYRSGNRVRPSLNGALQWRPNSNLEFYAEALYQGFRNEIDDRLVAVPLYNGAAYSNLVYREGTNLLQSGTVTGLADPIFTFQGGTYNKTDTFQYAVGTIYETGPLRLSADIARTNSTFRGSTESIDRIFTGQATTAVDFDFATPQFNIRNFDPTNPANYFFDGLYEEQQEAQGDDWQARIDAVYEMPGDFFIRSIEAGVRYSDRDAHREFGNRFAGFRGRNIRSNTLPLEFKLSPAGFRGTDIQPFRSFVTPTYDSIRDNRNELRQFVLANAPFGGFGTFTVGPPAPNPNETYDATEQTLSGYAQLNYAFGDTIDGVIGVRVVDTETKVTGTSTIAGVSSPINIGPSFTDYLPNASLRWRIVPDVQLRLSATQTRTRPTFAQLNPSFNLGAPDPTQGGRRFGGGGNPNLRPFTSNNYDAALEYYFSRTGFVAVSGFRRDLFGFIQNRDVDSVDPVLGPIRLNQPVNTGKGRIDGAEAQFQTFFDFGGLPTWLGGFGVQANVTYLDAETGFPNAAGDFDLDRILGVSKWTYNVVGLYEREGLSARLSYNKRGNFIGQRDNRGNDLYIQEVSPAPRLDLSVNYDIVENATLFFDWTNILKDPHRENFSSARDGAPRAEYVRFLRFDETTFSLGVRFRL